MAGRIRAGYRALSCQVALILGLGTFALSSATGVYLTDALFRAAIVYLLVTLMALVLKVVLVQMTDWTILEAGSQRAEKLLSEGKGSEHEAQTEESPPAGEGR